MSSFYTVVGVFIVVSAMSVLFWIMAPKNNQAVCLFCFVVQCLEKYSDFNIGHDVFDVGHYVPLPAPSLGGSTPFRFET
ncbi:AAR_G0005450.mRNA.1.CDS.1 [Saccharomyces cerevisiae]|nr:AAR_G0005450.mRNA.1.CDS.1 [Saccharomyces cerevisiae]CAI4936358.1 ATV_HP_G0093820.mRNA.1.CDS.1 [Saccharomyces cerevisiae]CAI4950551.1 ATV_HP_G0102980.mRNA.1.CDS.1 [Saccharomyces cerevisiae]CAI4997081.1 CFC_HP_G0098600.mRNA.1.CDS.1 [Saccharomyces cerevisiae]CAI4997753.1 CFC_HP_G0099160.mRNA.1.CDS.1 [Saccharomyces cerevisiae]